MYTKLITRTRFKTLRDIIPRTAPVSLERGELGKAMIGPSSNAMGGNAVQSGPTPNWTAPYRDGATWVKARKPSVVTR